MRGWSRSGEGFGDDAFEVDDVGGKFTDAVSEFVGCHGVFVQEPAEGFFIDMDAVDWLFGRPLGGQPAFDGGLGVLEFFQEIGADGEEVAAGQFEDFAHVAETRAHDLGLVTEFFVVGVNLVDRLDAGVFRADEVFAGGGLVVIKDSSDEGGNESHAVVSAGDGLSEGEHEGEVAVDAFLLQDPGSLGAFPGRSDFDEDAFAREAFLFVKADEVAGFFESAGDIERKAGIDFGGDASGDDLEDLLAKGNEQIVDDFFGESFAGEIAGAVFGDGRLEEREILRELNRFVDESWIGRGVLRFVFFDRGEIAGVGDDGGELFQLVELIHKNNRDGSLDTSSSELGGQGKMPGRDFFGGQGKFLGNQFS